MREDILLNFKAMRRATNPLIVAASRTQDAKLLRERSQLFFFISGAAQMYRIMSEALEVHTHHSYAGIPSIKSAAQEAYLEVIEEGLKPFLLSLAEGCEPFVERAIDIFDEVSVYDRAVDTQVFIGGIHNALYPVIGHLQRLDNKNHEQLAGNIQAGVLGMRAMQRAFLHAYQERKRTTDTADKLEVPLSHNALSILLHKHLIPIVGIFGATCRNRRFEDARASAILQLTGLVHAYPDRSHALPLRPKGPWFRAAAAAPRNRPHSP